MKTEKIYFSDLLDEKLYKKALLKDLLSKGAYLNTDAKKKIDGYHNAAKRIFKALDDNGVSYDFIHNTHDIWVRDFMPVKTRNEKYISFRYNPSYLEEYPLMKTDFEDEISNQFTELDIFYSEINLDGGNIVFSQSRNKVIISDRVFLENVELYSKDTSANNARIVRELEECLEARIIIIPSVKSDPTGHADGMVRFIDENTVVGNQYNTDSKNVLEQRIKTIVNNHGIEVIDFPCEFENAIYLNKSKKATRGCYINYLETDKYIFMPEFGAKKADQKARKTADKCFKEKTIVAENINEIAAEGGVLNCISWEL